MTQPNALFAPAPIQRAIPQSLTQMLINGLAGGAASAAYFQVYYQIVALAEEIANGSATWIADTTKTGQPIWFAQIGTGASAAFFVITPNIDAQILLGQAAGQGTVVVDSVSYTIAGTLQLQFQSAQQVGWVSESYVGIASPLTDPSQVAPFIQTMLDSFKTALNTTLVANGPGGVDPLVDSLDVDFEVVKSIVSEEEGVLAMKSIALGVATAVVFDVIDTVLHNTYHRIVLVNMTDSDVTWSNPYTNEGTNAASPMIGDPAEPSGYVVANVVPAQQTATIGGVQTTVYTDAGFMWVSSSEMSGLGYVYELSFTSPAGTPYTAAFLFNLPWASENALAAAFHAVNPQQWWIHNSGQTSLTASAISADGRYELTVTYDQLDGTQPPPGGGPEVYWYNSTVVLQQIV